MNKSTSTRYSHIQPKISSFRASSRKKSREDLHSGENIQVGGGPIIQINNKPRIPSSRVKAVTKQNKETFVMQKQGVSQANQNFETLKNNFMGYKASRESKVNAPRMMRVQSARKTI